jgi:ribbon-helix-helix CopG family protein
MGKVVQARLDDQTDQMLAELRRRTHLSDSELIRRGIRSLAVLPAAGGGPRVIGIGRFQSGVADLGSNKTHLRGFGRR